MYFSQTVKAMQRGYTYDRLVILRYLIRVIDIVRRSITHFAESLAIVGALFVNMAHFSTGEASELTLVERRFESGVVLGLTL